MFSTTTSFERGSKSSYILMIFTSTILVIVFILSSCSSMVSAQGEDQVTPTASNITPEVHFTPNVVSTPAVVTSSLVETTFLVPSQSPIPTQIFNPTPDTRPIPYYWREWKTNPDLSPRAQEIVMKLVNDPGLASLDAHAFSKVGDCQMTSGTFLGGFANGKYLIPDGYSETVRWFSKSMTGESITAANGLGINSVLNPMFGLSAGYPQCEANETPLDCELRTKRPAFVLIAMGTNWKPNGELSFEKYLRVVVDRVLETGALPILATKADNIEGDWKLNQAIAQVAYDYDLPLVNIWRSVQDLPNHGLESPKNIYLTGDGWMRRNYAWLDILEDIRALIVQ